MEEYALEDASTLKKLAIFCVKGARPNPKIFREVASRARRIRNSIDCCELIDQEHVYHVYFRKTSEHEYNREKTHEVVIKTPEAEWPHAVNRDAPMGSFTSDFFDLEHP